MPEFTVPEELEGISVQHFLRRYCHVSARLLAKLKRTEKGMTVGEQKIRSIDTLHAGDVVCLRFPQDTSDIIPVFMQPDIVYEDETLLIVNKPPFMPVHPVREHQTDTLANGIMFYSRQKGENYTFRAVNRLDKDTSGLIAVAKNAYAHTFLIRHIEKKYRALCEGELYGSGTIRTPIRLKEGSVMQREAAEGGMSAVTHYTSVAVENGHTLLSLWLETGRTHQIRVHLSSIGHPLAGDELYGGSRRIFQRQCLHCESLCLTHPVSGEKMMFSRKAEDWMKLLRDFSSS